MRVYRVFYDGPLPHDSSEITLSEDESHHLTRVRRASQGHPVIVINGQGSLRHGVIESIGKRETRVAIEPENAVDSESLPVNYGLAQALLPMTTFEEIIPRVTELGASFFWPVAAERTVVSIPEKKLASRVERWRALVQESLKQCERLWMPELDAPRTLSETLEKCHDQGLIPVALLERSEETVAVERLPTELAGRSCIFFVGPEGGWTESEVELLKREAMPVNLGSAILRSETAALAAMAFAMLHLGPGPNRSD